MHRFFVNERDISGNHITIRDKNELNHMARVLRLKIGDQVIVFDGKGTEYEVTIDETAVDYWSATVNNKIYRPNNPKIHLSLIQGIAKGDKMDLIIQKAVEIGVNTLYPVLTEHTVVKLDGEKAHKRMQRWEAIALEACKQSRRNTLLTIKPISSFAEVIKKTRGISSIMLYEKEEQVSLKEILRQQDILTNEVFLIIGPEGGFSPNELEMAKENGVFIATLGQKILRTETASIVGSAIVLYELGDLG